MVPALWHAEAAVAGVAEAGSGAELTDVSDELCVLDVPPLIVGATLMTGRTVIVWLTMTIGTAPPVGVLAREGAGVGAAWDAIWAFVIAP